jgi:hypothetical protein
VRAREASEAGNFRGHLRRAELSPVPRLSQTCSTVRRFDCVVRFTASRNQSLERQSHRTDLGKRLATKNLDCGNQLLGYCQEMNEKAQRIAGLFIAPLIMLIGVWLCLEGLEHGKLRGIFSIGPFVAVAGALWFVSDWFE